MGYKRAEWHSGLTYEQSCEHCKTIVRYKDDQLGFRPWYADGFVYCPTCKTPLRHNEKYAIDAPESITPTFVDLSAPKGSSKPVAPVQQAPAPQIAPGQSRFCSKCGAPFREDDKFCAQCGAKRD